MEQHTEFPLRDSLPGKMISQDNISLWSIIKNCIGKDLSKIAMPVVFNEPLSFLQRITENAEYMELLDKAILSDDVIQRMEIVAAFAVGGLSNNANRMNKPFNPLLGETYELMLPRTGYRVVCEQVSHHPPISAYFGESDKFILRGSVQPKLKFWGKSIEVKPDGFVNLELKKHKEVYTWRNVNCCVHNVIVGKLWFEQYGVMEIVNHTHGVKAVINFKQSGWFGKDLNRVDGFIHNRKGEKVRFLYGKWTDYLKSADVMDYEEHMRENPQKDFKIPEKPIIEGRNSNGNAVSDSPLRLFTRNSRTASDSTSQEEPFDPDDRTETDIPKSDSSHSLDIPNSRLLWRVTPRPENAADYYNFTAMSMMLNQDRPDMRDTLPPTDCRLRPDIRLLEQGEVDQAASEKNRLEEKQREARKLMKKTGTSWQPLWFDPGINPHTKLEDWNFNGKYWKRDFSKCPDIF